MKHALLALVFLFPFFAQAQTPLDNPNITFTLRYETVMELRQAVAVPDLQTAIASATLGLTDTSKGVELTLSEIDLVQTYRALSNQPAWIGSPLIDAILAAIGPQLKQHPYAASTIAQIAKDNANRRKQLFKAGQKANENLQKAIDNN